MAKKHVKSTDPRKSQIVGCLKWKHGGSKVTLLQEISPGVFEGDVLLHVGRGRGDKNTACCGNGSYKRLGRFQMTAKEAGLE